MTKHMDPLSSWAKSVAPSPTLAIDAQAKAMQAAGEDVCGFGVGEPDFDTPEFIKAACAKALSEGKTKYTPAAGIPALREALAQKYMQENGLKNIEPSQVVVSPGGKFSCYLAILAVCSPGDEVILPAPYWVSYPEMIKLAGATPKMVHAGKDVQFKLTPEMLRAAITPKTRMLILNSPSNPTGMVYSREELEALAPIIVEHNLYVLSDEIYEYFLYENAQHHSIASFSEALQALTITMGGFSKSYSMTGWRLGALVASPQIAKAIASIQSHTTSNPTSFAQYGALAIFKEPEHAKAAVAEMLKAFEKRRAYLYERLQAMPGVDCPKSEGAFYLFPSIEGLGIPSAKFAASLLEKEKVALVPGVAFGDDTCIRLSYATSMETLEKGADRLERFCKTAG